MTRTDAAGFSPRLAWPLGAFLAILFVLPLLLLCGLSLRTADGLSLAQYGKFLGDAFSLGVLGGTMQVGVEVTLGCLLLGFPLAWLHARSSPRMRALLMLVVLLPLLTSVVVRTFGWIVVLGRQGIVNQALLGMGVIQTPLRLLYTEGGVVAALTQVRMPLMVLPLVRPGILAGGFICFMASFDNIPVSLFLRDAATGMLPIRMWQDLEGKLDVTIAARSGVLIVATVAVMLLMERLVGLFRRLT